MSYNISKLSPTELKVFNILEYEQPTNDELAQRVLGWSGYYANGNIRKVISQIRHKLPGIQISCIGSGKYRMTRPFESYMDKQVGIIKGRRGRPRAF